MWLGPGSFHPTAPYGNTLPRFGMWISAKSGRNEISRARLALHFSMIAYPTTADISLKEKALSTAELALLNSYWRAANYLSVGQIYLLDNPLLKEPLKLDHIKPRLLGHWGTTPGLNFIYVHLNRIINARDVNMIYIAGPGHGGPGIVANTYLEGTYSEM